MCACMLCSFQAWPFAGSPADCAAGLLAAGAAILDPDLFPTSYHDSLSNCLRSLTQCGGRSYRSSYTMVFSVYACHRATSWQSSLRQRPMQRQDLSQHVRRRRWTTSLVAAAPSDILVCDFDGVIVDSEPEVSTSAIQAAAEHWPHIFGPAALPEAERRRVAAGLRCTRPRLVKGSEAMLMARLILEDGDAAIQAILDAWEDSVLPASLQRFGEGDGAALHGAFEAVRSRQMEGDFQAWQALNLPYPGVQDALRETPYPWWASISRVDCTRGCPPSDCRSPPHQHRPP